MDPDATLMHHPRHLMRLWKRRKRMSTHEFNDQLMWWLLGLKTPLHADQEIFGAFSGDLKARGDCFKWLRLVHVVLPDGIAQVAQYLI